MLLVKRTAAEVEFATDACTATWIRLLTLPAPFQSAATCSAVVALL
jgi:hypothetical protein